MITYQYSQFQPEDEPYNTDVLMSILSDLIMKYDISLDEALKYIIEKGVPVNLFLKDGGMDDLVLNFQQKLQSTVESVLKYYDLQTVKEKLSQSLKEDKKKLKKNLRNSPNWNAQIQKAIEEENQDLLRRLLWKLSSAVSSNSALEKNLEQIQQKMQDHDIIQNGLKKYNFTGSHIPTVQEAVQIIKNLDQIAALMRGLQDAINSGDLYNINLKNLAKYLGPESYQEFMEKRESIFEKLKELLKQRRVIVENEEGGIELSPSSIRKIGKVALSEIFSNLKPDTSSGYHNTKHYGESENVVSATKKFEFGDSISHIDYLGSIQNSLAGGRGKRPSLFDLEVNLSRGSAKSYTVVLLDMSGSMDRALRFYNAKKVTLAIDNLIKNEYKDDKLTIIGFGSTAKIIPVSKIPTLQPYPVTIFNPYIKLRYDFSKISKHDIDNNVPMYFTNLQKGLNLARQTLSSKQYKNKQIILITDGAPTAHFQGSTLHINYPPAPSDFDEALSEVKKCKEDGIEVNTFLLTNEWDMNYFGEKSFIQQFAKISVGKVFYPHPTELNQMIIFDFIQNKKKKFAF
ncbi:MAG: VWA domain-containing protein [Leptospiraceae bacterium]|nr:VWA domain-containing protein [Leptospiraceae bacterium]MCP5494681.1 VWA domain-containing protein [Leptospiraceae bacterium]